MPRYYLTVHLRSDATFGRGAGVAGLVDVEIEHDTDGLPLIGGRTLKGLLVEEWANLRYALGSTPAWDGPATWLFGTTGEQSAHMHVGLATLPPDLCAALKDAVRARHLSAEEILASLTSVRRQTSLNASTGAPQESSLRRIRVLLRETDLIAPLDFDQDFTEKERTLGLLAACALAVRRGGLSRNRGRGRLEMRIHERLPVAYRDAAFTHACFQAFANEVRL
jgi:hypothetical protein